MTRVPAAPYIAPFATLILLLALGSILPGGLEWAYPIRTLAVCAVLWWMSRGLVRLRPAHAIQSVLLGMVVFAIWVGPDYFWPAYRDHWLFRHALLGGIRINLGSKRLCKIFDAIEVPIRTFRWDAAIKIKGSIAPRRCRIKTGWATKTYWATQGMASCNRLQRLRELPTIFAV